MNDHGTRYRPLTFVQSGYDRASLARLRPGAVRRQLDEGSALLLFVLDRKAGVRALGDGFAAGYVEASRMARPLRERIEAVFLGEVAGRAVFSVPCEHDPAEEFDLDTGPLQFIDLRQVATMIDPDEASLLGYAFAMDYWHRGHRFCGACGRPTTVEHVGHMRTCSGPACGRRQFPRTDPAVIVLAHDDGHCLLGRQVSWPERRYSTIAGFVEPGETPEQAVRREVYEETGICVSDVEYRESQPWPFPGSLMLGYYARASAGAPISLLDGELQDARWFSRDEITKEVSRGQLRLPTRISIAYRLIESWFDRAGGANLADIDPSSGR